MKPVVGIVVSNKMQKSVVVAVDRLFHNKVYNRFVKRTSKFMAHGEADKCNISDMCFTWICEERLMNFVNAIVRRRTGELKGEMGDAKIHYGWRIHHL